MTTATLLMKIAASAFFAALAAAGVLCAVAAPTEAVGPVDVGGLAEVLCFVSVF